jgi:hypothetical protein
LLSLASVRGEQSQDNPTVTVADVVQLTVTGQCTVIIINKDTPVTAV